MLSTANSEVIRD